MILKKSRLPFFVEIVDACIYRLTLKRYKLNGTITKYWPDHKISSKHAIYCLFHLRILRISTPTCSREFL